MLQQSFQHIPGIGLKTEQRLWQNGIVDWRCAADGDSIQLSSRLRGAIQRYVAESMNHLADNDPAYFSNLLPASMHWRFFPEFRDATAYLDIETTGLEVWDSAITTIALYDGKDIHYYIQGQNLNDFMTDIQRYKVIVTYNGKTFDVPFIESYFGIELTQAHIDLRYVLKQLGYTGGLKGCEKALGIDRGELDGVDGFFAVYLWQAYVQQQDGKALETLLAYNIADVVNLEQLMVLAYNLQLKNTPFHASHALPMPQAPVIPFAPDVRTIDRIKRKLYAV